MKDKRYWENVVISCLLTMVILIFIAGVWERLF